MWIKILALLSIITTTLYLLAVAVGWDEQFEFYRASMGQMIEDYVDKPRFDRRTVAVIECGDDPVCKDTVKSLLNQNMKLDDIAVQTTKPVDSELEKITTVHKPHTDIIREGEVDTVVIKLINGKVYAYGAVEEMVSRSLNSEYPV